MIITTTQKHVEVPGGEADKPTEIPARGWLQVAKRGWKEAKADNVQLLAAGVAFYAFLAIFPALIAVSRLLTPAEALHNAITTEITRPIPRVERPRVASDVT